MSDFQNNLYAPLADLEEIHLDAALSDDYLVQGGDILFVRSNGNPDLVGRSVIVPPPNEPTSFSGFTIRARIEDERALPIFYAHFFKSWDFAEMIKTVGRGANIRNLSQSILSELKIPLPPKSTQQAIVADVETSLDEGKGECGNGTSRHQRFAKESRQDRGIHLFVHRRYRDLRPALYPCTSCANQELTIGPARRLTYGVTIGDDRLSMAAQQENA